MDNTEYLGNNRRNSQVLKYIWLNPGVFRKELANVFKCHSNIVTDIVRELINEEWVREGDAKAGKPGRAPIPLYIDSKNRAALSITYDQSRLMCGLVNSEGEILNQIEKKSEFKDPEEIVETAEKCVKKMTQNFSGRVIGIGIGDPGMVDSLKGLVVRSSLFPLWHNVPLGGSIAEKTGLPVFLGETTRARALGEYLSRPELRRSGQPMLYLDYGIGIGIALVSSNRVWVGSGFAGEAGHVVLDPEGPMCGCGARGCIESLANTQAIESKAQEWLENGTGSVLQDADRPCADEIFKAALEGDRMAQSVVREIIRHLELPIAVLVSTLHPRCLVIGAESEAAVTCIASGLKAGLQTRILPEIASSIEICEGETVNDITLTSAGLMVFDEVIMHKSQGFIEVRQ